MTDKNVPAPLPENEPIGSPMNDNETKPYPANDPLRDLLNDQTVPLPSGAESASTPHTQDATTTESFAWTGAETTASAPPTGAGANSWTNTAPQAAAASPGSSAPAAAAVPTEPQGPRPARAGTIVWGCILFLIAALAAVPAILGDSVLSPTAFLWIVVGFGTLLVVGAIIGAIVSTATRRSRTERTTTY